MRDYIQILIFVIMGVALLWFGYSLLIKPWSRIRQNWNGHHPQRSPRKPAESGSPGDPQVCPICSTKLYRGDLVQTHAFPSITGGKDRLMHIRGCLYCINGDLERKCPVCGAILSMGEILIARMFDRSRYRSHVHIVGCSKCRRINS